VASLASARGAERLIFGEAYLADVQELIVFWSEAQAVLARAASDPLFLSYVALGPEGLGLADDRRRQLMRQVERELQRMRALTAAWAQPAIDPMVQGGANVALQSAAEQGSRAVLGGALGFANTNTIRVLAEEVLADTGFAADSALRVVGRHLRATQQTLVSEAALNAELLVSEARLERADERARRLARLLRAHATQGELVNINGRFWTLEAYADVVARTRLAEAATAGSYNATLAMGIDLVRVSDHGRTDPKCDAFAGKVFSISGKDPRFPPLERRPPFHPRCRHALLPFVPELRSEREMEFAIARSRGEIDPGVGIQEFFGAAAS